MSEIACIVGSGFSRARFEGRQHETTDTPFGATSSPIWTTTFGGVEVHVLARHGLAHEFAPHAVNYRANIQALRDIGVRFCFGLNAVGGIAEPLSPGTLAVPHQLVDYTWGRESSFGSADGGVTHIEFTNPFSPRIRAALEDGCALAGLPVLRGVYAVTQGPRLETAAEIDRLERDGCAMVGMTAMPEAALAREAGIEYGILAGVINHAPGRAPAGRSLHAEMLEVMDSVMMSSERVLAHAAGVLAAEEL